MTAEYPTSKTLLEKLKDVYGQDKLQPDIFGRRDALPTEIYRAIHPPLVVEINRRKRKKHKNRR